MENEYEIEVACLISMLPDVSGTDDGSSKADTPKGHGTETMLLGDTPNRCMTVISF